MTFMQWLAGLFKNKPIEAPAPPAVVDPGNVVKELVVVKPAYYPPAITRVGEFRTRMWVTIPTGEVGILTGLTETHAAVTVTKPDGTNQMVIVGDKAVPLVKVLLLGEIRPAYIDEIPARQSDVDHDTHMRTFGYIHSSEAA